MPIINQVVKGGGTTPTGTISITANGTYDVTDKATADVQVPTTAPAHYLQFNEESTQTGMTLSRRNVPIATLNLNGITTVTYNAFFGLFSNFNNSDSALNFMSGITTILGGGCSYMFAYGGGSTNFSFDLSSLVTIDANGCENMFVQNSRLSSIDISSLQTITENFACRYMLSSCGVLTSINLSALTTISGSNACVGMCQGCYALSGINLSALTTISGSNACSQMFWGNTNLVGVDLGSLTTVSGNTACSSMFGNTGLTHIDFSSLTMITGSGAFNRTFTSCTNLTRVSFYALTPSSFGTYTNQFNSMLQGVTGCTVHFPMAIQSTIGSWSDVTNGFGGTNTTVLFDIVTSLTGADTNTYTRSQKNSTGTATAWDNGGTLYYTSGTTEPAVNDTIYSDSACTTPVTTVASIA